LIAPVAERLLVMTPVRSRFSPPSRCSGTAPIRPGALLERCLSRLAEFEPRVGAFVGDARLFAGAVWLNNLLAAAI
jgi:hypothetical protein